MHFIKDRSSSLVSSQLSGHFSWRMFLLTGPYLPQSPRSRRRNGLNQLLIVIIDPLLSEVFWFVHVVWGHTWLWYRIPERRRHQVKCSKVRLVQCEHIFTCYIGQSGILPMAIQDELHAHLAALQHRSRRCNVVTISICWWAIGLVWGEEHDIYLFWLSNYTRSRKC